MKLITNKIEDKLNMKFPSSMSGIVIIQMYADYVKFERRIFIWSWLRVVNFNRFLDRSRSDMEYEFS